VFTCDYRKNKEVLMAEDLGKYARHPLRTAGTAFLVGIGAGMMASKARKHNRSALQKFFDQLSD
jgi:hypothetical protein